MNFQKIQLPARVVADLFKNSLVMSEKRNSDEELVTGQPQYRFLGNHLKKITLIISNTNNFFLPEDQMLFLTRMLEACKMTFADVAVLNHNSVPVNIHALREQLNPKIIILFGVEPKEIKLPFNSAAFKIQEYDQCNYLYCPGLDELNLETEEGKLLKSKLWVCLRKLFNV
jgi:hypothetical protein